MDVADRVVYMHGGKILKDMTLTDFQALPESEILAMGLRCRNLSHVKKTAIAPKTSSNELEVAGNISPSWKTDNLSRSEFYCSWRRSHCCCWEKRCGKNNACPCLVRITKK